MTQKYSSYIRYNWLTKIILADRTKHLSIKYSIPIKEVQNLLQYDPTKGRYLEWIVKNHKSNKLRFPEDGSKTIETLTAFTKLHPVLKRNNIPIDINLYSYSDLVRLIEQYGEQKSKREQYKINEVEGVKELLDFPPYKAVLILTPEASAKLCRGTEWCVKDPKFFKGYSDNLIMVLKGGEPYYLVHEESDQYKDIYDEGLLSDSNDVNNPEALEVLNTLYRSGIIKEPIGGDFGFTMLDLLSEETIAKSPKLSYYYAEHVIKSRFEEGEAAIATDALFSYHYAMFVLKGRFELGEQIISKNDYFSYYYAKDIIKGRFELGEAAIATSAQNSFRYAQQVLKGRFELGEPSIAKEPGWSDSYARFVIDGRFKLGEEVISKDAQFSYNYAVHILKDRFLLGEPAIATNAHFSYLYALDVVKGRFELGESVIFNSVQFSNPYRYHILGQNKNIF